MITKHDDRAVRPPVEQNDPSTLLPMLVGGLALIMIGMIVVALLV